MLLMLNDYGPTKLGLFFFFTLNNVSDLEEMWLEILDVFVLNDSCTV